MHGHVTSAPTMPFRAYRSGTTGAGCMQRFFSWWHQYGTKQLEPHARPDYAGSRVLTRQRFVCRLCHDTNRCSEGVEMPAQAEYEDWYDEVVAQDAIVEP